MHPVVRKQENIFMNLQHLTIEQARELLDTKKVSVQELVDYYRSVIAEKDPEIHAYLEVFDDIDTSIARAQKMIDEGTQNILTGIPYALKDNILYKDHIASSASKILEHYRAPYHAHVIEQLEIQGAIPLGRTNMDEFAMGSSTEYSAYGPTKNPLNTARVPGGTSGGSAAAVAMDACVFALGSDTAGSIRQPASFCGVVGYKPTYGSVSRSGLMALGSSLDAIGPIARTARDAEIVHTIIAQPDPSDNTSATEELRREAQSLKKIKKIGVPRKFFHVDGVDPLVIKNFESALEKLVSAGYELIDIDLPHVALSLPVYYIILPAEASANLARYDGIRYGTRIAGKDILDTYLQSRQAGFGPETRRRIILGTYVLSAGYSDAYYGQATRLRNVIREEMNEVFKTVDVIATPTTPTIAFKFGEKEDPVSMYLSDIFNVPANITGVPALSLPSGTGEDAMPLGIQFMAPHFHDQQLFDLGKDFQSL